MDKSAKDEKNANTVGIAARVTYFFIILVIFVSLCLSPWIIHSMYTEIVANSSDADSIPLITSPTTEGLTIDITFNSLDVVNSTANLTVTGYKNCVSPVQCASLGNKLLISYFYLGKKNIDRIPPYDAIVLPADKSVYQDTFNIPVIGDIASYPYDSWNSHISLSVFDANGNPVTADLKKINLSVDEKITKLKINDYQLINTNLTNTHIPDLYALNINFNRPFYVKYTTTVVVLLLFFATLCTIVFTDHAKLIMSSAGIILGIWGARSLIIGFLPPDLTLIDMILLILVILVLMSVAWKVASHIKKGGKFSG